MKNQIFSVMLSAAIFTIHPAFCMQNDEDHAKSIHRTFYPFVELAPEMQVRVLSNLDNITMESMLFVSKPYKTFIETFLIKKIDLVADFSRCHLGYMKKDSNVENIAFSLQMRMDEGEDNRFVSIGNFNFDSRKKVCLPWATNKLRKKIILYSFNGRLEFLLDAKLKDLQPIELEDLGYVKFNDQQNTTVLEKAKIPNNTEFKLAVYIEQDPWSKFHFGNYRYFNVKERRKEIRYYDRQAIIRQLQGEMSKTFENIDLSNPIFAPYLAQAFSNMNLESSDEDFESFDEDFESFDEDFESFDEDFESFDDDFESFDDD